MIVRNPRGLYNVFSETQRDWILTDATEDELIEFCAKKAALQERERVQEVVDRIKIGSHYAEISYDEAMEIIRTRKINEGTCPDCGVPLEDPMFSLVDELFFCPICEKNFRKELKFK